MRESLAPMHTEEKNAKENDGAETVITAQNAKDQGPYGIAKKSNRH